MCGVCVCAHARACACACVCACIHAHGLQARVPRRRRGSRPPRWVLCRAHPMTPEWWLATRLGTCVPSLATMCRTVTPFAPARPPARAPIHPRRLRPRPRSWPTAWPSIRTARGSRTGWACWVERRGECIGMHVHRSAWGDSAHAMYIRLHIQGPSVALLAQAPASTLAGCGDLCCTYP